MRRVHAFGDDALGDLDAVGVADAIRAGRVGRAEVVEAAIARAEAVNPALNGLVHRAYQQARAAAAGAAADGYFSGVPTFLKDNVDIAGQPTMHGTDAWTPWNATSDSEFTEVFLATGLTPVGKTQLSEFGFSASAEHPRLGPVRNPWDTDYSAGASSSGSGAFVAAGVVPIAHANDGGGSIRIPASCNGLVGLKPSRGRLPLDPHLRRMPVGIVANGVVTRSVRDTAAFYREAERTWRNPKLAPVGDVTGPGRQRLRIAVLTRSVQRESSPQVRELTLKSAALLEELGHRVEHLDEPPVPASFVDDFVLYWGFLALAQVRSGRRDVRRDVRPHPAGQPDAGPRAAQRPQPAPAAAGDHAAAQDPPTHRAVSSAPTTSVLTPTLADETPRIGHLAPTDYRQVIDRLIDWVSFTPLQNVTGEPAISLPLAQSADGMPVGMMLSADIGQEALLLELAYELEEARPWARIQD